MRLNQFSKNADTGFVHGHSSEITPQAVYAQRREWLKQIAAGAAGLSMASWASREALAQAAALLAFDTLGAAPDDKTVYYFAGIDGARFKRPVEPGDQLTLEVELERMKAGIFKFKARAKVGDAVATEADLMCTMRSIA